MMEIYESGTLIRNILDAANVNSNLPVMKKVKYINIKHVKRKNETEDYLFLKDVMAGEEANFPLLDDAIRKDVFKFFNTQLTNALNRQLKTVYAKIRIINGIPQEGVITIDDYSEDLKDLLALARKDDKLELALRKLKFEKDLGMEIDESVKEDLNYMCQSDENLLPLIYVNEVNVIKLESVNIPKNTAFKKGLPVLIKDVNRFFPKSGIDMQTIQGETIIMTDSINIIANRNFNENLAIRKCSFEEFESYAVVK